MFNSIKTVLPSFDGNPNVLDAKEMKEKPFQEQNLFQGFLNFGSKPEDVPAINLSYHISEASVSSIVFSRLLILSCLGRSFDGSRKTFLGGKK